MGYFPQRPQNLPFKKVGEFPPLERRSRRKSWLDVKSTATAVAAWPDPEWRLDFPSGAGYSFRKFLDGGVKAQ